MSNLKKLIAALRVYGLRRFVGHFLYEVYLFWMRNVRGSYSQAREDLVLDSLLGNKRKGFYVDVGAGDPNRFNNTKRFYLRGWRGINIDPDPDCYRRLVKTRNRDINLNLGIRETQRRMYLFKFLPDTLSTFSNAKASEYQRLGFKLIRKIRIDTRKLSDVLNRYHKNKTIDFISIDTEGQEYAVLKGNDWKNFRPRIICIEISRKDLMGNPIKPKDEKLILNFLSKYGYKERFNNGLNRIFVDILS